MCLFWLQWFLKIYILQGSVATHSRSDGIISNYVIANCPRNVPVKNFENRLIVGENMDVFLRHSVHYTGSKKSTAGKNTKKLQ